MDNKHKIDPFSTEELLKVGVKILQGWYWVVIAVAIAVGVAWLVNRYTDAVYQVQATLNINENEREQSAISLEDVLESQSPIRRSGEKNIRKEIALINSYTNVFNTIKALDFNVSYFLEGDFKTSEMYPQGPVVVTYDTTGNVPYGVRFACNIVDEEHYRLSTDHPVWSKRIEDRRFNFGETENVEGFLFTLKLRDKSYAKNKDAIPLFRINRPEQLAARYRSKLNFRQVENNTMILSVSTTGNNPRKEQAFINEFLIQVVDQSLKQNNEYATRSINFIENQIDVMADSLRYFSNRMENLRLNNRALLDSGNIFNKISKLEEQKVELKYNLNYLKYLEEYVRKKQPEEAFGPEFLGIESIKVEEIFNDYNELRFRVKTAQTDGNRENPLIRQEEKELKAMKEDILEKLANTQSYFRDQLEQVETELGTTLDSVRRVLSEQKALNNLERMYTIHEGLYDLLLKKKLEASISKAANTADYHILDKARTTGKITPTPEKNYQYALIVGILVPVVVIGLMHYLNNRVESRDMLTKLSDFPVIGTVFHAPHKNEMVIPDNPKSLIAESFRAIRSNLQYLVKENLKNQTSKVILLTSPISGEGKTFCTVNLGYILSLTEKRTLLIGGDLRKPKLHQIFGVPGETGLSNYLAGSVTNPSDIIYPSGFDNLDVIPSGPIPPNPAELLIGDSMEILFRELRSRYDFIVIDTSPVELVSDAVELMKLTDINLFIVRQNRTPRPSIAYINELQEKNNFQNPAFIFNDIKRRRLGYGYGYGYNGYGYYEKPKPNNMFERMMRRRRR